jgi:beta-lactamase superfamily II metal-dependent hydrolase
MRQPDSAIPLDFSRRGAIYRNVLKSRASMQVPIMKSLVIIWSLFIAGTSFAAEPAAEFYFIDTGLGNATLIKAPSGETILLDTGVRQTLGRVVGAMRGIGITKLDYLVSTHYHQDHFGAAVGLSEAFPVGHFVDHGASVEYGKTDAWWKERRLPWYHDGMGKEYDDTVDAYFKAREKSDHIVVKPGDQIPIKGFEVLVLTAGGKCIEKSLPGAGQPNPECKVDARRAHDDAEDAQSIGVLVTMGKFRFVYLGDLTWNESLDLFCPNNKVGTIDAYVVTHHGQSIPKVPLGDYYWGLSACPPAEVHALRPRVAFLSLNKLGHKVGDGLAMEALLSSPGLEDLWQTEKVISGGEQGHNPPDDFIANNLSEQTPSARYIKMIAQGDGSMEVSNSRTGFTKKYPARK